MALRRLAGAAPKMMANNAVRHSAMPPFGGGMSHDQRVTAWVDYFDHPECDLFYFARGNRACVSDDWIAPPEVWQAMLYNCRRNSCLPSALRVLEQLRALEEVKTKPKGQVEQSIWNFWIIFDFLFLSRITM